MTAKQVRLFKTDKILNTIRSSCPSCFWSYLAGTIMFASLKRFSVRTNKSCLILIFCIKCLGEWVTRGPFLTGSFSICCLVANNKTHSNTLESHSGYFCLFTGLAAFEKFISCMKLLAGVLLHPVQHPALGLVVLHSWAHVFFACVFFIKVRCHLKLNGQSKVLWIQEARGKEDWSQGRARRKALPRHIRGNGMLHRRLFLI